MAEVIEGFEKRNRAGRASIYPWEQWMDGRSWRLKRGEDYSCKDASMQGTIHCHASREGMKVVTSIREGEVYLRFVPRPTKRPKLNKRQEAQG